MQRPPRRLGLTFLALAVLPACSDRFGVRDTPPTDAADAADAAPAVTPVARWVAPRSGPNQFLLPWPSDLTLTASGFADLAYVPNPTNNNLVRGYVDAMAGRIAGFSTVGATYFRFSVPLDPQTLPQGLAASREPGASVQIVDVDAASPERGARHPAQYFFQARATRYWPENTLAVAPAFGFPLRPRTRYAVVVTTRVRAASGAPLERDEDLRAVLAETGGDEAVARARAAYSPALDELARAGVGRDEVLSLAVFTTQDPVGELFRAVDVAAAYEPPPSVTDIARMDAWPELKIYTGHYGPNPVFQAGTPPYDEAGSGDFARGADGTPQVQRTETITFALTIPTTEMPPGGYPIAIYAHGTGGNARSFIGDGTAAALAARGIAVLGFDQIFNGDRIVGAMGSAEAQFFNFANPLAGRTNNRQAAIDLVTAGRLVRRLRVPPEVSGEAREITFDASRVMFFGHSQGGLNGPLWLAAEDGAGAAVLSGAGGTLAVTLTQKTEPVNIPSLLATGLGIPVSAASELVPLHPVITLAQTIVDVSDPVNYARYIVREPRPGRRAKHVFQTLGLIDRYTPPDSIASLAIATGLQLVAPVLQPYETYDLLGLPVASEALRGNLGAGRATGAWMQFAAPRGRDGHFVIFDLVPAKTRAAAFLASHLSDPDGVPTFGP